MHFLLKLMVIGAVAALWCGCISYMQPLKSKPATMGVRSTANSQLKSLPQPKEKIVAAVYKFRDQTGQYKVSSSSSSFSTAVTQGATSILLRAMEESGWFVPIEREGLSNLLNERKIIRSSRAEYLGATGKEEQPLLPPLLFAGIILEGGIISYETNLLTGGPGIKYFGVGASGQYREDRVTVYLRATSTQNGRILKTVYTSKTILSQLVDFNLYKFVSFQKLLEAEVGYSYNEPADLCVTEAIEKAVYCLVLEGINDKLWELKNPVEMHSDLMKAYQQEKEAADRTDSFGERLLERGQFGVGLAVGGQMVAADYPGSFIKPGAMMNLQLELSSEYWLGVNFGLGNLAVRKYFDAVTYHGELVVGYRFLPGYRMTPFLFAGGGMVSVTTRPKYKEDPAWRDKWHPLVLVGGGVEYLLNENWGVTLVAENRYVFSDNLDGLEQGKWNDFYWSGRVGVVFYSGR